MCGEQRMLDDVAQQLGARQLARDEMPPFGEQQPGTILVAALERVADVGEVMAELAKAERQVQHRDVEEQREQRAYALEQHVQHDRRARRRQHRDQPRDQAVAAVAALEGLLEPAGPRRERGLHAPALAERLPLLDDQRGDDRDHAHASIL